MKFILIFILGALLTSCSDNTNYQKGYRSGFLEGKSEGHSQGFIEGRRAGYYEGSSILIKNHWLPSLGTGVCIAVSIFPAVMLLAMGRSFLLSAFKLASLLYDKLALWLRWRTSWIQVFCQNISINLMSEFSISEVKRDFIVKQKMHRKEIFKQMEVETKASKEFDIASAPDQKEFVPEEELLKKTKQVFNENITK